ncbi:cytochrome P450 [Prauserella flavalba]|uniref:cytochrome P450 n=1 Tax=Prauserella flavalba TaxID=1477506 RepID=UPI0036EB11D1
MIEEFLRYDGPINLATLRYTTEPVRVDGVEIPAHALVLVALLAANRDEARVPDPDRLDITRSANGHLAFAEAGDALCWRDSTLVHALESLRVRLT